LCVSFLAFYLIELAPGQYFEGLRLNPQISRQTLAALETDYGLNRPLPLRYVEWLRSIGRGELGFSFTYNTPVWPLVRPRLRNTLLLTTTALLCSWLIAIPLGIWLANHRRHWQDRLFAFATTFFLALPDLLVGLLLLVFALYTQWFPTGGMFSLTRADLGPWGKLQDLVWHLFLPVAGLVAGTLPILVRHVRSAMIEVLQAPFIIAAESHGIARRRLLLRHAFPAAMNSLLSLFGVTVGMLLGTSLLIEFIMSWPGLGPMLVQAILERDSYVVIAIVICSTLLLAAGNLIADVSLYFADPRIRQEAGRSQ
jgi:peptide/nickel transport system permease protein